MKVAGDFETAFVDGILAVCRKTNRPSRRMLNPERQLTASTIEMHKQTTLHGEPTIGRNLGFTDNNRYANSIRRRKENTLMKTNSTPPEPFESTYALIVRSEDKNQGLSEAVIYALLLISAVSALWQFGQYPFTVPTTLRPHSTSFAQAAKVQQRGT